VRRSAFLLCTALAALGLLPSCKQPMTVEQQVIAAILEVEEKIEAGERRAFMEHISEDFRGQNGAMNHDQLRAYVLLQLNRYKRLQGQLFPIHVEDRGDGQATAWFRALVTGGPGWLPESGQVFEFETHWRMEDGEWLLVVANWDPVPLDEVL
jgi:hypothetical protein